MPVIDPHEHLTLVVLWSTFSIFAAVSNAFLLTVTLLTKKKEVNIVLVHLEAIFVFTCASGSLLIWTGHAMDSNPPYGLCLVNASISMANVPLQGASALAIALSVWVSVVEIYCRPSLAELLRWVTWAPFLLALPYVTGLPLFFAGLYKGITDKTLIYRGSPFYCVVDYPPLQTAASALGAITTFLCVVFPIWTTANLVSTRWRVRRITDYPVIAYPFVIRTLLFAVFVAIAFAVGIVSLQTGFSDIVPDVVLSTCGIAVFFIFSSSKHVMNFIFRCRRPDKSLELRSASPAGWPSAQRRAPREFSPIHNFSFSVTSPRSPRTGGSSSTAPWQSMSRVGGEPAAG